MVPPHGARSALDLQRPNLRRVPANQTRCGRRGGKRVRECRNSLRLSARVIRPDPRSTALSRPREVFAWDAVRDGIYEIGNAIEAGGTAAAIRDRASQELTTESKSYVTFLWPSRRDLTDRAFFFCRKSLRLHQARRLDENSHRRCHRGL